MKVTFLRLVRGLWRPWTVKNPPGSGAARRLVDGPRGAAVRQERGIDFADTQPRVFEHELVVPGPRLEPVRRKAARTEAAAATGWHEATAP